MIRKLIPVVVVTLLASFLIALLVFGPPTELRYAYAAGTPTATATPTATPTPSIYSEYTYSSGVGTKGAITSAVTAATVANLVSHDAPLSVLTSNPFVSQTFTAAQTAALGILAGMTGPAPDAEVQISAYSDPSTSAAIPYATVNKVTVSVSEVWP